MPPGKFLAEYSELLDRTKDDAPDTRTLHPILYEAIRVAAVTSTAAWALGAESRIVKLTANATFAVLQKYVVDFNKDLWSYNSHLNIFLGLISLADTSSRGEAADSPDHAAQESTAVAALMALQAYYAWVYLQSGLSKVVASGWSWTHGSTLRGAWGELGTPAGKKLAVSDIRWARAASVATIIFELGFAPALLTGWRYRQSLGASSAAFHGAIKATMNISFWHLSWFSAPLFVLPRPAVEVAALNVRAMRAPRRKRWAVLAGVVVAAAPLVPVVLKEAARCTRELRRNI
ncbi:hypothetical protein GCM10009612_72520 [Streptomyces beijiangensis]